MDTSLLRYEILYYVNTFCPWDLVSKALSEHVLNGSFRAALPIPSFLASASEEEAKGPSSGKCLHKNINRICKSQVSSQQDSGLKCGMNK